MALSYYKRFRMEMDLRGRNFSNPPLPTGYYFVPWNQSTVEEHAQVKFLLLSSRNRFARFSVSWRLRRLLAFDERNLAQEWLSSRSNLVALH